MMMMMIFWSNWWNEFGRGNRSTRRKPAPAPLCPPQNPTWRPGLEPRTAAVGSQRLTAWAMARPIVQFLEKLYIFSCTYSISRVWSFIVTTDNNSPSEIAALGQNLTYRHQQWSYHWSWWHLLRGTEQVSQESVYKRNVLQYAVLFWYKTGMTSAVFPLLQQLNFDILKTVHPASQN
jgi:hypothetical protein